MSICEYLGEHCHSFERPRLVLKLAMKLDQSSVDRGLCERWVNLSSNGSQICRNREPNASLQTGSKEALVRVGCSAALQFRVALMYSDKITPGRGVVSCKADTLSTTARNLES